MRGVGVAELCRLAAVAVAPYKTAPGVDVAEVRAAVVADLLEIVLGWGRGERRPDNAEAYLWTVAQASAQLTAWRMTSPVSVTEHARRTRSPFESVPEEVLRDWRAPQPSPEAAVANSEWRAAVRARLLELTAQAPEDEQAVVRAIVCTGATPREAAAEAKVPSARVWVISSRLRRRILADEQLRELHAQLEED